MPWGMCVHGVAKNRILVTSFSTFRNLRKMILTLQMLLGNRASDVSGERQCELKFELVANDRRVYKSLTWYVIIYYSGSLISQVCRLQSGNCGWICAWKCQYFRKINKFTAEANQSTQRPANVGASHCIFVQQVTKMFALHSNTSHLSANNTGAYRSAFKHSSLIFWLNFSAKSICSNSRMNKNPIYQFDCRQRQIMQLRDVFNVYSRSRQAPLVIRIILNNPISTHIVRLI